MSQPRTLIVTVPDMISEDDLRPLRAVSDVDYVERPAISEEELVAQCDGYDYLMLNYDVVPSVGEVKLSSDFYAQAPINALKAIATDITGMDWASPGSAAKNGVTLINIPHYSTESVAETVLCEVLLHSRQRHRAYMDALRGDKPHGRKGLNLAGRTAGVLGVGSIGRRVAELLESLGMRVIIWNRSARDGFEQVGLEELFERADVICISVKTVKKGPDANVDLVDGRLLSRCDGAIIVNLANIALVDHEAMTEAIVAGKVFGYTVEWDDELRATELGQLEQVHFPPHDAWHSDESLAALRETWVSNVVSAISGRPVNIYTD